MLQAFSAAVLAAKRRQKRIGTPVPASRFPSADYKMLGRSVSRCAPHVNEPTTAASVYGLDKDGAGERMFTFIQGWGDLPYLSRQSRMASLR